MTGLPSTLSIGVLINEIEGSFQSPIVHALKKSAAQLGVRLVFYPGRIPYSKFEFEQQFNILYEFINGTNLDGLLVFGTTLKTDLSDEALLAFVKQFALPSVMVGMETAEFPCVTLDNYQGYYDLVSHFITVHGYRHIAMISGPKTNPDARERLQAYQDALAAHGIEYNPMLVEYGRFDRFSGAAAVESLFASGVQFDAIVGANDEMALAAMQVALDAGLRVPTDVAIGGFDDIKQPQHQVLGLTTVNQPIDTLSAQGLQLLVDELRGVATAAHLKMQCHLVVRQSCGCTESHGKHGLSLQGNPMLATDKSAFLKQMGVTETQRQAFSDDLDQLSQAFLYEIEAAAQDIKFESVVRDLGAQYFKQDGDAKHLHSLLFYLRKHIEEEAGHSAPPQAAAVARRLARANVALTALVASLQVGSEDARQFGNWNFRNFLKNRISTYDIDRFFAAFFDALTTIKVETCYISFYTEQFVYGKDKHMQLPATSRLMFAVEHGAEVYGCRGELFATIGLVPPSLQMQTGFQALTVLPLFHHHDHFGFIVMDLNSTRKFLYEDIRDEISSDVKGSLLVSELAHARDLLRAELDKARKDNQQLSMLAHLDELTALYNRRGFFDLARARLAAAHQQGVAVTLIFADLDGLKTINDTWGHEEGDFAIKTSANLLKEAFRTSDILGRLGGDEFVILTENNAEAYLSGIRQRVYSRFDLFNVHARKPYEIGCSLGYLVVDPHHVHSLETILAEADKYLYDEKRRRKAMRLAREAGPKP